MLGAHRFDIKFDKPYYFTKPLTGHCIFEKLGFHFCDQTCLSGCPLTITTPAYMIANALYNSLTDKTQSSLPITRGASVLVQFLIYCTMFIFIIRLNADNASPSIILLLENDVGPGLSVKRLRMLVLHCRGPPWEIIFYSVMSADVIHCPTSILAAFEKVVLSHPLDLALVRAHDSRKHILYTWKGLYDLNLWNTIIQSQTIGKCYLFYDQNLFI